MTALLEIDLISLTLVFESTKKLVSRSTGPLTFSWTRAEALRICCFAVTLRPHLHSIRRLIADVQKRGPELESLQAWTDQQMAWLEVKPLMQGQ